MLLNLKPDSEMPIYLQLRQQIVQGIVRNELAAGDHLPSVRQMAIDLGINLHTVNKAYTALAEEGFVKILGRRGVIVAPIPPYDEVFLEHMQKEIETLYMEAKGRMVPKDLFEALIASAIRKMEED